MKRGKNTFTSSEIKEIKKLIDLKLKSDTNKQKVIRDKIRKIGFYYSEYSSSKKGYTNADLDKLIQKNLITIT